MKFGVATAICLCVLLLSAAAPLLAQTSEDMAFVNRTGVTRNGLSLRFVLPVDGAAPQPVIVDSGALPVLGGTAAPLGTSSFPALDTVHLTGGSVLQDGRVPATVGQYMRFTGTAGPNGVLDVLQAVWMQNSVASHTVVRFRAVNTLGVPADGITITLLDAAGVALTVTDVLVSNDLGFQPYGCGYSLMAPLPSTAPALGFNCDIGGYECEIGTIQLTCSDARAVSQILVRWTDSGVKKGSSASQPVENSSDGEDDPVDAGLGVRLSANQNIDRVWPRRGNMTQQTGVKSKHLYLCGGSVAPGAMATERGWVTIASLDTGAIDIKFSLERWYRPSGGAVPERIYCEFNEPAGSTTLNAASTPAGALNAVVAGHSLGTRPGQFHNGLECNGGSGTASFVDSGWSPNLGPGAYTISMWLKRNGAVPLTQLSGGLMGAVGMPVNVVLVPAGTIGTPPKVVLTVGSGPSTASCIVDVPEPYIGDGVVVSFTRDAQNILRGYRNGTQFVQLTGVAHSFTSASTLRIGSVGTGIPSANNVVMDEFRLYPRELNAAELAATYTSALASPTSQAQFQTQGSQLFFSVDGLVGTGLQPVDIYRPVGSSVSLMLFSQVLGAPGDVMLTSNTDTLRPQESLQFGSPLPSFILNLDITAPTFGSFFGLTFTTPLPTIPLGTSLPLGGAIDLSMQALVMSPSSPGGFAGSQPIGLHVVNTGSGAVVQGPIADNTFVAVQPGAMPLCGPQTVSFYGTAYTQFFVNANGNITFGTGSPDFTPTIAEFMSNAPRIAALWSDMGPQISGQITVTCVGGAVITRWDEIPGTDSGGVLPLFSPATVIATFQPGGGVRISEYTPPRVWRSALNTSIVGISPGGGLGLPLPVTWSNFAGLGPQTNASPLTAPFQFVSGGAPSGFSEIEFPAANGLFFRVW